MVSYLHILSSASLISRYPWLVSLYVYMHVCMHEYIYVLVCMYSYVCMYVCTYVYMNVCMYVCMLYSLYIQISLAHVVYQRQSWAVATSRAAEEARSACRPLDRWKKKKNQLRQIEWLVLTYISRNRLSAAVRSLPCLPCSAHNQLTSIIHTF